MWHRIVPWQLRAPCKVWSEQGLWVAKQSQHFGPTGLILSSCFCFSREANRLTDRLALLTPGASQASASAVQRSLPSLSQCHPCCTCQCHWCPCRAPVPVPGRLSLCLLIGCFQKEGDSSWAVDVSHVTLAREGSTCRVPVQSQQHPGKVGEGSEPGPNWPEEKL